MEQTMWHATVLTIFPDMFPGPLGQSLAGKALSAGLWRLDALDIRAAATRRHGQGRLRSRGELRPGAFGIPALYAAAAVRGPRHPGCAPWRRPRPHQGLPAGRGRAADPRAPRRPLASLSDAQKALI